MPDISALQICKYPNVHIAYCCQRKDDELMTAQSRGRTSLAKPTTTNGRWLSGPSCVHETKQSCPCCACVQIYYQGYEKFTMPVRRKKKDNSNVILNQGLTSDSQAATDDEHCSWRPCRTRSRSAAAHSSFDLREQPASAPCFRAVSRVCTPHIINAIDDKMRAV
jgi:hypothetical protein